MEALSPLTIGLIVYLAWVTYSMIGIALIVRDEGDIDAGSAWLIIATAPVLVTFIIFWKFINMIKEWRIR